MSHEITEHDKQQGLSQAWHGLTEVLPVILLSTCFLATWDVLKRVLYRKYVNDAGVTVEEETDTCELACTDNPALVIGQPVNCKSYSVLSNKRFLEIVQNTLDKIRGAFVASVLSCQGRSRIAVSVAIPPMETIVTATSPGTFVVNAAGREFQFYLNFLSSHNKSAPFTVVMSSVCTVCNNTFNMNLQDKDGTKLRISIPHTKNMEAALNNVPEIIAAFFTTAQKFAEVMQALSLVPTTAQEAKAFFAGFLTEKDKSQEADEQTDTETAEISSRRENQIDRLLSLFVSGKGNTGKNLADVFSAITDYYTHENSGGEDKLKQVASSEFGNGQTMKAYAFAILQDDKRIGKLIAKGQKVLDGVKE